MGKQSALRTAKAQTIQDSNAARSAAPKACEPNVSNAVAMPKRPSKNALKICKTREA